jgi:4a-hydroxytetrahydrobiopterin dehydratase
MMDYLTGQHCEKINASTAKMEESEARRMVRDLNGWQILEKAGELRLEKTYPFENFDQAAAFASRVAQAAILEDHHPTILTEWGKVTVTWWTHKIKGLHMNDFIMAAQTERLFARVPTRS